MAFFNALLSTFGYQDPSRQRSVAQESSSGERAEIPLPPELIGSIASFLPIESAASLSICCQSIYSTLGTQYLKALGDEKLDRYKFLALLERQLPNYILCYYCETLHAIDKARRHLKSCYKASSKDYLSCWISDLELESGYFIHSDFSFTVFQMTMKQHRLGHDCSELLDLLAMKPTTYLHYGYVERHAVLAKIIAGSLVLREQRVFMLPADRPLPVPWDLLVVICPHFQKLSMSSFDQHGSILLPKLAHWDTPEYHQKGTMQCRHCLTEFKVNYRNFGEHGNAMFVTRWLNLGRGESALDREWQSHVRGVEVRGRIPKEWPLIPFDRGSLRAAFEQEDGMESDSETLLSSQDEEELFRQSPYTWPKNV